MYECSAYMSMCHVLLGAVGSYQRRSDHLELELWVAGWPQLVCWELVPHSLREQVCSAGETSLWPLILDVLYLTGFAYFQLVPFEPPKLSF